MSFNPYKPSAARDLSYDTKQRSLTLSANEFTGSSIVDDYSFKFDTLTSPLKSTQQINIDWSKFENHCFFSSAEVKVNEAFNNIVNGFPFDGSKIEVLQFLDKLTGYEKWVYDQFPTWSGALHFSGTQVNEDPANGYSQKLGTWIEVKDKSGYLYPELSKNNEGTSILSFDKSVSFTIETELFLPTQQNDIQIIAQKIDHNKHGLTLYLDSSASTEEVNLNFCYKTKRAHATTAAKIKKGIYNHICVTIDNTSDEAELVVYVNYIKVASSQKKIFSDLDTGSYPLLIGSGSSFYSAASVVTIPLQTLSGTLDEFKVFHSVRSEDQQRANAQKGMYAIPSLKLYYRFNEPPPPISAYGLNDIVNAVVLDSSGNSLHATINNFTGSLRVNANEDDLNPLVYERREYQVTLFPAYQLVKDLNQTLLEEAKKYDIANPNIITKLIPKHYLLEGASEEGFEDVEGFAGSSYGGSGIPGQGEKGSVQLILSFLYIWSKFFDEIKLFIDTFGNLRTISYDSNDSVPDNFIDDLMKYYGSFVPKFFNNASLAQYAEGEDIEGIDYTTTPLKKIQADILRRVLVNLPKILKSKGTHHSIRSFLRSIGVDPDNSIRIREYGGSTIKKLGETREKRTEFNSLIDFNGNELVYSTFMSSSRVEPGIPRRRGSLVYDNYNKIIGTSQASDGLFTSGSWTFEGIYKIPINKQNKITDTDGNQSLLRLFVTGSGTDSSNGGLVAAVVAKPPVNDELAKLTAYFRPGDSINSPVKKVEISLDEKGIFSGEKWFISFGRLRNDNESLMLPVSSSYFLRAATCVDGVIDKYYVTSSFFEETPNGENNIFETVSSTLNASGSFFTIGNNQSISTGLLRRFLNDTVEAPAEARTTDYIGLISNFRFWTAALSTDEWQEHVKNFKSVGTKNPQTNWNYVSTISGSFERLRLHTFLNQPNVTTDINGNIEFLNFAETNLKVYGKDFDSEIKVATGDMFAYSHLSPSFDEASTDDKVRIRNFQNADFLKESAWSSTITSSDKNYFVQEIPKDDLRLSIEISLIDALDKDIVTIFSSFDVLNNAIGNPELAFNIDYPDLENLRKQYFNRISEKLNFKKFFEFYRWFDVSMSSFIEQLIPYKTKYKGTNFIVESHLLERHKHQYHHSKNYLGDKVVVRNDDITFDGKA